MIEIKLGKRTWTAYGHAPKYICFCVSRIFDILIIETGDDPSFLEQDGMSSCRAGNTKLHKAMRNMLLMLAANYPRHVKVVK